MSVTADQVQKVIRASVWARRITTFMLALIVAGLLWAVYFLLTAPMLGGKITIGHHVFPAAVLQPWHMKVWMMAVFLVVAALALTFVFLLRSIFSNLARGEIFCHPNVGHIRGLGLLLIAGGILQWTIPIATGAYLASMGHDDIAFASSVYTFDGLGPFAQGALMILLSWIMAVGLGVREDAEELRRDAELVI
jgi:hypothetical protein